MQSTLILEAGPAILSVAGRNEQKDLDRRGLEGPARRLEELALARRITAMDRAYSLSQVHGTRALYINGDEPEGPPFPEADALYTDRRGICLVVRTADCMPVFFTALGPDSRTVCGIIHAGWRGLAAGIVTRTLAEADELLGGASAIALYAGPCISGEHYEVGEEVAAHFEIVDRSRPRAHVDLVLNLEAEAMRFQESRRIPVTLDTNFAACTAGRNADYYSHRKGDTGRNLNLLFIR